MRFLRGSRCEPARAGISATGGRHADLYPWEPGGIYPPQEEFESTLGPDDSLTVTGPPGTVFFCDTSGFHRGGWARTKPRVLSYHTYVGASATKNPRYRVVVKGDVDLTPEAEFALSRSLKRKKA